MATCPMCRSPHARLGSTRPVIALRQAPAPQMLVHWAEHDLNHLDQIRAAHRRLAGRPRGGA